MFIHYLKTAIKQLIKYKTQTAISIISLAIGFTSFAMATLWIHYETTYDDFHKEAGRMYCITLKNSSPRAYSLTGSYLAKNCPEVEATATFLAWKSRLVINEEDYNNLYMIESDDDFLNLFDIHCIEGNNHFLLNTDEIAVTQELAQRAWGGQSPIGKKVKDSYSMEEYTVTAVIEGYGKHSYFPFDYIKGTKRKKDWYDTSWYHVIRLKPDTDSEAFFNKIDTLSIRPNCKYEDNLKVIPLSQMRQVWPQDNNHVKLNHIFLFSLAGGLLIICALLNYLTLFINRIYIRKREIALRTVFGSSSYRILIMFYTEFLLLLTASLLFGMLFMELLLPTFREVTGITSKTSAIYAETLFYSIGIMFIAFAFAVTPIKYFRKKSLNASISKQNGGLSYHTFRKLAIGIQLIVGISCTFCTFILIIQTQKLRHGDIGFQRENIACISANDMPSFIAFLKQQPEYIEGMAYPPLFPLYGSISISIRPKEKEHADEVSCQVINNSTKEFLTFYNIRLLKGKWLEPESDNNKVMINETAAKVMAWDDPIGQQFISESGSTYTVIGIVNDFYNISPTTPAKAYLFANNISEVSLSVNSYIFKFHPGTWLALKEKIERFFANDEQQILYSLNNSKEEYDKLLYSENILQHLLGIISTVCVLIALFGIYSMIILTCEQRRKEIAIRKVNGATVSNILKLFFQEYFILLFGAAAVAFPVGYICMKPWLESYIIQTSIPWWIYIIIFAKVGLLVFLCIGWQVWRTANNNPSKEIQKE